MVEFNVGNEFNTTVSLTPSNLNALRVYFNVAPIVPVVKVNAPVLLDSGKVKVNCESFVNLDTLGNDEKVGAVPVIANNVVVIVEDCLEAIVVKPAVLGITISP